MVLNKRLLVLGLLATLALASYAELHRHSPALVAYVVEETLVQKTAGKVEPTEVRSCFDVWLAAVPDGPPRLERLFALSQQLEKVQELSVLEFNKLLKEDAGALRIR